MNFTISTKTMQTLVSKAVKGASCNKMMPITSLLAIELKNHTLTLITTDASNYLFVSEDKVEGDDFYVVVQIDIFAKLIQRLTCSYITLELCDNLLKIKGNGSYILELPLDENGNLIIMPTPLNELRVCAPLYTCDLKLSTLNLIHNTAKYSLASITEMSDVPCYTGYYIHNQIYTTDQEQMCVIDIPVFEKPELLNATTVELLTLMTSENIRVYVFDTKITFVTDSCKVIGELRDDIDSFAVNSVQTLLNTEMNSNCSIRKEEIIQVLDRLALFVSPYDNNAVTLTFTKEGLQIQSRQSDGIELIPYITSDDFEPYTCNINIEMLKTQIKANTSDSVTLYYGSKQFIKIASGNVSQLIALVI